MQPTARRAMQSLRVVVAILLFIHGAARVVSGGVGGFGEFLTGSHIPAGPAVAWLITLVELIGTPVMAWGLFVRPLALFFAVQLMFGIALVHAPSGWFVVGGGRNGVEYSVLLIAVLLAQAWVAPVLGRDE